MRQARAQAIPNRFAADCVVVVLAAGALIFLVMVVGALVVGPSGPEPLPYLRFARLLTHAFGLAVLSYDAAHRADTRRAVPIMLWLGSLIAVAGGSIYFLLFFAYAPSNWTVLAFAAPGIVGILWEIRLALLKSSPAA